MIITLIYVYKYCIAVGRMIKLFFMEEIEIKKSQEPKSAKARKTRARILEAARAVFAEHGFAKTTAEEISTKAGVGYGTFYLYFKDKREALHTILSEVDAKLYHLGEDELAKYRRGLGALSTIKATISSFFDNFQANADVIKICHELSTTDPDFKAKHDEIRARLINRVKEHLLKGVEVGNVKNIDPEITSFALAGLIETIAIEWFFNNRQWDRDKVINTVAKLYLGAIIKS